DLGAVRAAVGGLWEEISAGIGTERVGIDPRADERAPLLGLCGLTRLARDQRGAVEGAIDVEADRARLAELYVAVAHGRNLAEWVDRIDVRCVRHHGDRFVRDAFLGADDAGDPDEVALRAADDFQFGHGILLSTV